MKIRVKLSKAKHQALLDEIKSNPKVVEELNKNPERLSELNNEVVKGKSEGSRRRSRSRSRSGPKRSRSMSRSLRNLLGCKEEKNQDSTSTLSTMNSSSSTMNASLSVSCFDDSLAMSSSSFSKLSLEDEAGPPTIDSPTCVARRRPRSKSLSCARVRTDTCDTSLVPPPRVSAYGTPSPRRGRRPRSQSMHHGQIQREPKSLEDCLSDYDEIVKEFSNGEVEPTSTGW